MKSVLMALAFWSCVYTWLGCLTQWFTGTGTDGPLSIGVLAFRFFAVLVTVCCLMAVWELGSAVIAIWLAALSYCLISWKVDADWVFHQQALRFTFWAPLFLTFAVLLGHHRPARSAR
jgi:hypothetical protein